MKKENRFSQVAGVLNANALRNVLLTDIFYKFYQNVWNTSCVSQNKRSKQTALSSKRSYEVRKAF